MPPAGIFLESDVWWRAAVVEPQRFCLFSSDFLAVEE